MKSVIIIGGASSAYLYVQECWQRGFRSVVVNPPYLGHLGDPFRKRVGDLVMFIEMESDDDYDTVLEQIKGMEPICVVPGSGGGVFLADRMAKDLGFVGNNPDTTWRRDTKKGMQQSLKDAGLRYIVTKAIESESDIDAFWRECGPHKVMMKFDGGVASVGNKVCHSLEEAKAYYRNMSKGRNAFGLSDLPLIQEYIEGDEYIVDTVSCNGRHMVSDIWKYRKILTRNNDVIYDETNLVVDPTPGITRLVTYAYKVLEATDLKYGPCHSEFKVDDKGPVLIEMNPRPMGAEMTAEYLDECLGHHITDIALDAFLCPTAFDLRSKKLYHPLMYASLKTLFSLRECDVNIYPLKAIVDCLSSFREASMEIEDKVIHVEKTVDLETSLLTIKMCNRNHEVITREKEFIDNLENEYADLLFVVDKTIPASKHRSDIKGTTDLFPLDWKILVVTEKERYVVHKGKKHSMEEYPGKYDALIYADASKTKIAERFTSIMGAIAMLYYNSPVVILPEVYENFPYSSVAMEIVLRLGKCSVEVPLANYSGSVVGIKMS